MGSTDRFPEWCSLDAVEFERIRNQEARNRCRNEAWSQPFGFSWRDSAVFPRNTVNHRRRSIRASRLRVHPRWFIPCRYLWGDSD